MRGEKGRRENWAQGPPGEEHCISVGTIAHTCHSSQLHSCTRKLHSNPNCDLNHNHTHTHTTQHHTAHTHTLHIAHTHTPHSTPTTQQHHTVHPHHSNITQHTPITATSHSSSSNYCVNLPNQQPGDPPLGGQPLRPLCGGRLLWLLPQCLHHQQGGPLHLGQGTLRPTGAQ